MGRWLEKHYFIYDIGEVLLHAISDYKKRLYKKRLVEFKEIKKRRLVRIYHAKKRNLLQYFQNALSRG